MGLLRFLGLLLLSLYSVTSEWHDDFGPWVVATKGEPWPLPKTRTLRDAFLIVRASTFNINVPENCDILEQAKNRYMTIVLTEAHYARLAPRDQEIRRPVSQDSNFRGTLDRLDIRVTGPCEQLPYLRMNESYSLDINDSGANLFSPSVWGALRGLETFSQLLVPSGENSDLKVQFQSISDEPKLPHRGLLLDTSRHFFPLEDIMLTLDAMSYNKLNVFHWHIVDDNSFPYQSQAFPELSQKGAWHPRMVYSGDDIKRIIEFARLRGIRVMPEFDTPGHVRSWGESHPELLTACYDSDGQPNGRLGPINPTNDNIWPFLRTLFNEVMNLFGDKFIHLGGDEVPFDCWRSNPDVIDYMKQHGIEGDFAQLESTYISELLKIPTRRNKSSVVWQEVFDNGVDLAPGTVVHVWTGLWSMELTGATNAGYPVLLSACWYLDHVAGGGDWQKYYKCDPLDFSGANKHLMLGGEACMWAEFVDSNNVHSRIWPRASAAAERLWSTETDTLDGAAQRLEEHTCRMNKRRVPAQPPNGPSVCFV